MPLDFTKKKKFRVDPWIVWEPTDQKADLLTEFQSFVVNYSKEDFNEYVEFLQNQTDRKLKGKLKGTRIINKKYLIALKYQIESFLNASYRKQVNHSSIIELSKKFYFEDLRKLSILAIARILQQTFFL